MKRSNLEALSVPDLVERFAAIAIEQDKALLFDEIAKFNRLFDRMQAVVAELKSRPGDQRRALVALFEHPNLQVRLSAARRLLAVALAASRRVIQANADSGRHPQAGDAGMCLWALDEGIFVPK